MNYLSCSLLDARGSFTDCTILFQGKPFACFTIVLFTAEFDMELRRDKQQIKLYKFRRSAPATTATHSRVIRLRRG